MSSTSDAPRIGMVTWDFDEPKGGMGRSLQWIVSSLAEGCEEIVTLSPRSADAGVLRLSKRWGGHILFSLLLPFVLHRWVRRHGITLLLLPVGPGGVFLFRRPPCQVSCIVYHTYAQQAALVPGERWKRMLIPWERRTLSCAQRVLCFAEDTRRVLIEWIGVPADRIALLLHAIDVDRWGGGEGGKDEDLVVCVARLDRRKGIDVLLAAWEQVAREHSSARLILVGRGESLRLRRRIRRFGSVERLPHVPLSALRPLVRRAAVSVCPSYLEGFGLAAAEAMAAGTAVVASDCDGLRSFIVHERTGLLVPPGDAGALAAAVSRLLSDGDLRRALAAAARREAGERFDAERAGKKLREAVGDMGHEM